MSRTAVAGLAAVLALAGCTDGAASGRGVLESQPRATPRVLAAETGQRWVGVGGVMVAVPAGWRTATGPCGTPDGPVVHFPGRAADVVGCRPLPTTAVSSLTFRSSGATTRPRPTGEVNGVRVTRAPVICLVGRPVGQCSTRFVVPQSGVQLEIVIRGPRAGDRVRALRDSLTPVPRGYVAVPLIDYGVSVDDATASLEAVGLKAASPSVDFPHYATGSQPAAGAVVARGGTVALTIGDG